MLSNDIDKKVKEYQISLMKESDMFISYSKAAVELIKVGLGESISSD
jgi:hypothetical protein